MTVPTIDNLPADLNLALMQGKYWATIMTIRDAEGVAIDVTGYVFRGQVRPYPTGPEAASFTFTIVDAPGGVVRVELLSADTVTLTGTRYQYDWEYADGAGEEHALVRGTIAVSPEVTHV